MLDINNKKAAKQFKVKILKERYATETFKIYVVDIVEGEDIKTNKANEYIINGNVHTLAQNVEYKVVGIEESHSTYGTQYRIINVRRNKPIDLKSSKAFLKEVITAKQADTLLEVYPDIIDKVINNNTKDIDLSKTKGIKEKTFKMIKSKILENFVLIELIDRFGGALSFSNIKRLYDKYENVRKVEQKLKEDPYECLCGLSRIGFKTADKILLNLQEDSIKNPALFQFNYDLKNSKQRMKAFIKNILNENQNSGHTIMNLKELTSKCNTFSIALMKYYLEILTEDEFFLDKGMGLVGYKSTVDTEKYILDTLLLMFKNSKDWNIEVEAYRQEGDIKLTDEQLKTLDNLLKYNVSVLTAPAGAGKSQSVKMAINMLDDLGKSYSLMTPTGKSAEVLAEYSNRDVGTIHRTLKYNPNEYPEWGYNKENVLYKDIIIIDEFGMVDIFLMKHLLEAIDHSRTKILLVFDAYQLASVGCGNLAHDILTSKVVPVNKLTKIFRYGEGGLMNIATKTRNSDEFLPSDFNGVKAFGLKKDYVFVQREDIKTHNEVVRIYTKLLEKFNIEDISVLVAQNVGSYGTLVFNKLIQDIIQKDRERPYYKRGDTYFYVGDKVIQTTNNYKAMNYKGEETQIYNGNTGVVIKASKGGIAVQFKDKIIVYSYAEEFQNLELGYCITFHKSQGSSIKQVIMVTPKAHSFMLNSNLLYVGETRAKERVYHVGDIRTVNRAIKKKENLQRNTCLNRFFKQYK